MYINKTNIKTSLGISGTDYDTRIDNIIPQILNAICNECKNDFLLEGKYGYVYEHDELEFVSPYIYYHNSVVEYPIAVGDFIRIYDSEYNDGMYQVNAKAGGATQSSLKIESVKTLKDETTSCFIALVQFPEEFLQLIADYINKYIINEINVKSEKIDDTQITYMSPEEYIRGQSKILDNYRKVFADSLFKGSEY